MIAIAIIIAAFILKSNVNIDQQNGGYQPTIDLTNHNPPKDSGTSNI